MTAECYTETSKQSYYPKRNKADDYNLKCYDVLCSSLIIILKSIFFSFKDLLQRKYVQHVRGQITKLFP